MVHWWWKILGVVLVLYSILAGLVIPLGPGISAAFPEKFPAGKTVDLTIWGYNTDFTAGEAVTVWLQNGEIDLAVHRDMICASNVRVIDPTTLSATIAIPSTLPSRQMQLIVQDEHDGTIVLERVLAIEGEFPRGELATCMDSIVNIEGASFMNFPNRELLEESIRNTFFHVVMWFAMVLLLLGSVIFAIRYLRSNNPLDDIRSSELANAGILMGMLGIVTGSVWAQYTWGAWWLNDPKLNSAAIAMLIYLAYAILRSSLEEEQKRARISAIYNIFAFVLMIVFLFVLPRMVSTLHPGAGGNPAFSQYDLDSTMRGIFYPAIVGWTLIGLWMAQLRTRLRMVARKTGMIE